MRKFRKHAGVVAALLALSLVAAACGDDGTDEPTGGGTVRRGADGLDHDLRVLDGGADLVGRR